MLEKIFGNVKGIFNTITIIDLIISSICVLFGIVCFSIQTMNPVVVAVISGMLLIGMGISAILSYIRRGGIVLFNLNMILGILIVAIGLVTLFLNYHLAIGIAIFLIVVGVQKVIYGIEFKKFNESSWLVTLVIGILFMIIAIILFFTSKDNVVVVTGITLLGYGIINIVNTILLRQRSSYFIA